MKDIYSPLDIDEEWDDIAPAMEGSGSSTAVLVRPDTPVETPAVTSEVAPDLSGNDGTSTLAPAAEVTAEAPAEMPADMSDTNMAQGLNEPIAEDAAFKVANPDMGMGMDSAPAKTDGTLNIGEINPATSAAASTTEMAMPTIDEPKADPKVTTPIPVIDMNEANSTPAAESITMPGESFTPEEKPVTGDRFEGMEEEKEKAPKVEKPEALKEEKPAAAELPVTHADKKDLMVDEGDSGSEMKFDMGDTDKAMESFEKESDEGDAGLMNSIDRYIGTLETSLSTKRDRHEKLINDAAKLQDEIDRDQARLDKGTQARDIMK